MGISRPDVASSFLLRHGSLSHIYPALCYPDINSSSKTLISRKSKGYTSASPEPISTQANMSLPSYKDAVTPLDPLDFVATYLSTHDLLTCSLVNKSFNSVFAKYLWEDPLRIIGNGAKRIPFHLEKYRLLSRSIAATRESTKHLVQTIDYRQQWIPKMYALPKHVSQRALTMDAGYWNSQRIVYKLLSDLPAHFPRARFLFLDDIEFPPSPSSPPPETCHPLLLSLRDCQNIATILSPDDAAEFLSEVIYLDISHTALRDSYGHPTYPLSHLMLPFLRTLKLQHVSLLDSDLRALLAASPHQLQLASLDVRDNKLTDGIIPDLEQHLVWRLDASSPPPRPPNYGATEQQNRYLESPPAYSERPRAEDEQQETFIRDAPHPPPDDPESFMERAREHADMGDIMPYAGLTALYLSGNAFTSDAFLRLVKASDRLQVLDLDVPFKETRYSASLPPPPTADGQPADEHEHTHPVETATHHLSLSLSPRLSTLRVHHALVTHPISSYMADTNPHLTSLTLTCIPPLSSPSLLSSLKTFLLAAATQERAISLARAGGGEGGRRGVKVRPGLRVLRLELGGEGVESVSGDRDADAFAAAGARDFSFFDDPGAEDGGGGKKDGEKGREGRRRGWMLGLS
ncbi:hypothetical protein GMDG_00018 [Pseudogymnoascus destructans 20631-21]|uniref:F-box domain-containing protein n=1 Tax=Pseudogymnoascus destructans (strain ATCC MYA-4855 / 20631-21) TaxID=658429 RepID=L8FL49_PSED2|nr:hypothetical protein GMDG_00018 [Pseudogymnoascus destructans 20631-21]